MFIAFKCSAYKHSKLLVLNGARHSIKPRQNGAGGKIHIRLDIKTIIVISVTGRFSGPTWALFWNRCSITMYLVINERRTFIPRQSQRVDGGFFFST